MYRKQAIKQGKLKDLDECIVNRPYNRGKLKDLDDRYLKWIWMNVS